MRNLISFLAGQPAEKEPQLDALHNQLAPFRLPFFDLPEELQNKIIKLLLQNHISTFNDLLKAFPSLIARILFMTDLSREDHQKFQYNGFSKTDKMRVDELKTIHFKYEFPPIRVFWYEKIESRFRRWDKQDLSLWRECWDERYLRQGDTVIATYYSETSTAKTIMEELCRRNKVAHVSLLAKAEDIPESYHHLSSAVVRNSSRLIHTERAKSWVENTIFHVRNAKKHFKIIDITDCESLDSVLSFPWVEDLRIKMKNDCIASSGYACVVPRVNVSAPNIVTLRLYYSNGRIPIVKLSSRKKSCHTLAITNTTHSGQSLGGTPPCGHLRESSRFMNEIWDWDLENKQTFGDLTSRFKKLCLYGVSDSVLNLVRWERITDMDWERPTRYNCNMSGTEKMDPVYIHAKGLSTLHTTTILKKDDPVPLFSAPMLEEIILVAKKGTDTVWDFDRVFQSYKFLKRVVVIYISHPSGLELNMKPFKIPKSTECLSVLGCHAPWLMFEHMEGGTFSPLAKLRYLCIDISYLKPILVKDDDEVNFTSLISLDLSKKYHALKHLRLTVQLCMSSNFEGIEGQGIDFKLVTASRLRRLDISPAAEVHSVELNGKSLPLENLCPKIPNYLRTWILEGKADAKAIVGVSREHFRLQQTADFW